MITEKEQYRVLFQKAARNRQLTPEERARQEEEQAEERKHKEGDRKRREDEVKALFEECGKILKQKRYRPRLKQLTDFLKSKENAVMFWENRHIKKIYDISNLDNFLCSIYVEEMEDETYERWLYKYLRSTFNNGLLINYPCIRRVNNEPISETFYKINFVNAFFYDRKYVSKTMLLESADDDYLRGLERSRLIKARKYKDLLDKNVTASRLARSTEDELYFLNPLFTKENNFIRLDTYDVWRNACKTALKREWEAVNQRAPIIIELLDELVRTRKIYIRELNKTK